jgi:hypothetical protein
VKIKTRKVDPRAEGGARILIKESDRDVSSLEKSSTDNSDDFLNSFLSSLIVLHHAIVLFSRFLFFT